MFRIVCDPSSGIMQLYWTEIIRSDSQMFVVCLVGVWQRNFEPVVCVCVCVCVYTPLVQKTNHNDVFWLIILIIITLASSNNTLPGDGD